MTLRRKIASGAVTLTAGRGVGQAAAFLRNVVIARAIGPADLGIAATFGMTLSFLEQLSTIAVDRLLVQAPDGDEPAFQGAAHLSQAIRGALLSLVLFALAWPLARVFGNPEALPAYHALALVPLLRGFIHLDTKRYQREYRFGADVIVDVVPNLVTALAAWPIARLLGDYHAVLVVVLLTTGLQVAMSHTLAERPYRWAMDREHARKIFAFGWPLMINGMLLFCIMEGDQFVIASGESVFGNPFSKADLGSYSVAAGVALAPGVIVTSASAVMFPAMSKAQNDRETFSRRYDLMIEAIALVSALFAAFFVAQGALLIDLFYGSKYALAGVLIAWLGVGQTFRFLRIAPALAAMATGDTRCMMYTNLVRWLGFAGAVVAAALGADIVVIAASAAGGEVLSLFAAYLWLRTRQAIPIGRGVRAAALLFASAGLGAAAVVLGGPDAPAWLRVTLGALAVAGAGGLAIGFQPRIAAEVRALSWKGVMSSLRARRAPSPPGGSD